MAAVAIHGQGVAARCCAWLLERGGGTVAMVEGTQARVPALVVSAGTTRLLADVFEQPDLFAGLPRIERRVVAWGREAAPVTLPHSAVVVSEEALLARLRPVESRAVRDADWAVFAGGHPPSQVAERHFGTRRAAAVAVEMKAPEAAACWVESLEGGWLFLVPGWLIAVGGAPEALLMESRLVADQIGAVGSPAGSFAAYPRMADPVCGSGWLACGSGAMAFDPICGDGTGNAVREAILAAAVIRAAERGEPVEALLAHYRARLTAAFQKHMQLCREFYRAGNAGPWWAAEIEALEQGLRWCAGQSAAPPRFEYCLRDFDLLPVS